MRARNPGLWLALCALSFLPFSLDVFELPHQFILAVGALVCAWRGTARGYAAALVVLAVSALATWTSSAPWLSWPALVTLVVLAMFATSADEFDATPVLWTTWPVAAWAVLQAVGRDPLQWSQAAQWCGGVRPFATLGHPTQLGLWMAMVAVLALDHQTRWSLATAAVAAMTCVLTLSRAGWLALGVGVVTWVLLRGRLPRRLWAGALAVLALATPVVLLGAPAVLERVTHFFTAPTRVHLWGTAWRGFLAHPGLGWGLETFTLVDQQYRHPEAWRYEWGATANHAHSFLPNLAATQGLAGLALVGALAALVVRRWVRIPRQERKVGAIAAVVTLSVGSMVAFSSVPVAALGLAALVHSLALPVVRARSAFALALAAVALTALMLGASVSAYVGLRREGDVARAVRFLETAQRLEPWNAMWPTRLGAVRESQREYSAARAAYEVGARLAPGIAVYEANVGRTSSNLADAAATREWFERARHHAPLDARIARDAAEAAIRVGDFDVAEATLRSTLGLYPTDGPAWFTLAVLRLRQNRPVEARAALEAALGADWRDWPDGPQVAKAVLSQLLTAAGDPALAEKVANAPSTPLPVDVCGAPAFLSR